MPVAVKLDWWTGFFPFWTYDSRRITMQTMTIIMGMRRSTIACRVTSEWFERRVPWNYYLLLCSVAAVELTWARWSNSISCQNNCTTFLHNLQPMSVLCKPWIGSMSELPSSIVPAQQPPDHWKCMHPSCPEKIWKCVKSIMNYCMSKIPSITCSILRNKAKSRQTQMPQRCRFNRSMRWFEKLFDWTQLRKTGWCEKQPHCNNILLHVALAGTQMQ